MDGSEDRHYNQDKLFILDDGLCAPYSLVLFIFNGSHYERTINQNNEDTPLFYMGEDIPDIALQMCKITL